MILGVLGWWYGRGLGQFVTWLKSRLSATADLFSLGLMLKTLFAPFRQIGNEASDKTGFELWLERTASRLISRFIGFLMRTVMLLIGAILITLQIAASLLALAVYLTVPWWWAIIIGVIIWI
jgi:hypothetical protein